MPAAISVWPVRAPGAVVALSQYVQHSYAADLLDSGDSHGVPVTEH
jgi:hypothetical protein